MNERKMALLSQIIKEYIRTATPVGSKLLAGKPRFDLSSATIRNEMVELENEGYLTQPHTSAGRVPTALGYKFYLETLQQGRLASSMAVELKQLIRKFKAERIEVLIRELAKKVADFSDNTVVVGFSENDVFYTGIANLFKQPEFKDPVRVYHMSMIIDHLDKVMSEIFDEIKAVEVKIGKDNPFGEQCSSVMTAWGKKKKGIFGILGPLRMDYERNLDLVNFVNQHV